MQQDVSVKKGSDIELRPRFQIELPISNQRVLQAFEKKSKAQSNFIVSRVDDHVFIKFPRESQEFWTPQLHLEINEIDTNTSKLYGLFGPRPSIWLMFMFFHLIIALIFIGFAIWCYTNWSLGNPFALQLFVTVLMVIIWVILYVMGRVGRATSKPEMNKLYNFMESVLERL